MTSRIYTFLSELSQKYGPTGDVDKDIMIALVALVLLYFLLAMLFVLKRGKPQEAPAFDLGKGVMGRLEKLEMTINTLKTENSRANQINYSELVYLKQELQLIRTALGGKVPALLEDESEKPLPDPFAADQAPPGLDQSEEISKKKALSSEHSLNSGLKKTREGFFLKLRSFFSGRSKVDAGFYEELEELLITSDLGVKTTTDLIDKLKAEAQASSELTEESLTSLLKTKILDMLEFDSDPAEIRPVRSENGPFVIMIVGVNGVGKTTSVAKLANQWKLKGLKTLVIAADTFRAAAVEQLRAWCDEVGVEVVSGREDAKPQTVVFDGMERAQEEGYDLVLIDTAGRLHNKSNLMQELQGVLNMVRRHQPDAPHETLLVVDGATGQNAISQAREFNQALKLSGLIVTKLDGTPKGGVVIAIKNELGIPVRFIGVGEAKEDLMPFEAHEFVEALFDSVRAEQISSAHGAERVERRSAA